MRIPPLALLTALSLGACSPLTSTHPLFTVADQTGPPPLTEGVWVALDTNCTRDQAAATPLPDGCEPLAVHRSADGSWLVSGSKVEDGVQHTQTIHLIVAPAVPTANADAFAPLYIVQFSPREADANDDASRDARIYGAIAPVGGLPAQEIIFFDIECGAALREGPIDGITAEQDAQGHPTHCTAAKPEAARLAAQRAAIENLGNVDQSRMIFLHP